MNLRCATTDDIDALRSLQQRAHPQAWTRDQWRGEIEGSHGLVWLAQDEDGHLCASLTMWRVLDTLEVVDLVVDAEYRRQGLATALMTTAIGIASASGIRQITLEVRRDNEAANKLYEQFGFVEMNLKSGYYEDGGAARKMSFSTR